MAHVTFHQLEFPTTFGDTLSLTAVALGFVMGPVIDAINRRRWSSEQKAIGAFAWCLLASVLLVYVMGHANPQDWLRTFLIVFVTAVALHRAYWKPSGISDAIDRASG
jgi:uncharacterized membrane protein YoaK (UPF0700 family)